MDGPLLVYSHSLWAFRWPKSALLSQLLAGFTSGVPSFAATNGALLLLGSLVGTLFCFPFVEYIDQIFLLSPVWAGLTKPCLEREVPAQMFDDGPEIGPIGI